MKRASLICFVLFLTTIQAAANSNWCDVAINPPNPTSSDIVAITLSGDWPNSCVPNTSSVSVVGSDIYFHVILDYPPGIICATVMTPWQLTEPLSPLSPGTYSLYVSLDRGPWTLATEFVVAQANTYVFVPDQSTVVKTGGLAGIHETYTIEGQFQLAVNFDANTAWFSQVDGDLYYDGVPLDTTLDILLRMTEMISTAVSDTTIEFQSSPLPGGINGELTLTFEEDDSVHLTGTFGVAYPDGYQFDLDAVARKKYTAGQVSWIPGESSPDDWTIQPNCPFTSNLIQFSGPTAIFGNNCSAEISIGGTPTLNIDPVNKIIELWFQPPAPEGCTTVFLPVCGLEGYFGPLEAGQWLFSGNDPNATFSIPFEVTSPIYYVDADATGTDDGSSWANAFNYLQDALTPVTPTNCEIRVAQGVYKPAKGPSPIPEIDWREFTFHLMDSVTIKGGYAGYGEPDPNARDIKAYETILSGDLLGNDGEVLDPCDLLDDPCRAENSYNVVTAYDVDETACLDGFTITGGNANGNSGFSWTGYDGNDCGGGMLINSPWPDGNCSPVIANCIFENNKAANNGGGIYVYHSAPAIKNCAFQGNIAENDGGGLCNAIASSTIVKNCSFIENKALSVSGGMYNFHCELIIISNCFFISNVASDHASAILNTTASATVTNCTFYGNYTSYEGVVVIYQGGGELRITNGILWNDTEAEGYYEIKNGWDTYISYCDIQGGVENGINNSSSMSELYDGGGNINADPLFVDPCNSDYHLKSEGWRWEPARQRWHYDQITSPCIDAGNPGCKLGDEPLTLPEDPDNYWGVNVRINMGAYGGTAQAGIPPHNWMLLSDLTNDRKVDSDDLAAFVQFWPDTGQCIPSDLDRNESVNSGDFAIFSQQWSGNLVAPPIMTYQIQDCNPQAFTFTDLPSQTRFTVTVEGQYIHFEDLMVANCCTLELTLEMTVDSDLITIYEIENTAGPLCACICDYPVTATLGQFEPGTYTLEVYEDFSGFIGTTTIIIPQPQ